MIAETKEIGERFFTLTKGRRYFAAGSAAGSSKLFTVTIIDITDGNIGSWGAHGSVVDRVFGLSYDERNRIINQFNNGPISFDGRVW